MLSVYPASRASIPERGAMWRELRAASVARFVGTWIDEDGLGQTPSMSLLWRRILEVEIPACDLVVLYADRFDFPLKGAIGESCAALSLGKDVRIVCPEMTDEEIRRLLGSWVEHDAVRLFPDVREACTFPLVEGRLYGQSLARVR